MQAASGRTYVEVDPQALQEVQAYWRGLVQAVQSQLGRGFDAQLVVYGLRGAMVPSAAPGDPGKASTLGWLFWPLPLLRKQGACPASPAPAPAPPMSSFQEPPLLSGPHPHTRPLHSFFPSPL